MAAKYLQVWMRTPGINKNLYGHPKTYLHIHRNSLQFSPSLTLRFNSNFNVKFSGSIDSDAEAYLETSATQSDIQSIALNRPQSRNSISIRLLKEFRECLEVVRRNRSIRALIIRSTLKGNFCAGADLIERQTMSDTQTSIFLDDLRDTFGILENLPIPTIAAIDGPALGGGLELALACDFRVASPDVNKIGLPETRLGIIPGAGGTQRAVRLLGISKAKNLIFTGRMLNTLEALEWGIVDYISEEDQSAFHRSFELAKEMMSSAPLALRAAKMALSQAPDLPLESGLHFERTCYQTLLGTKDRDEALTAFKEKRRPFFKGE